MDAGGSATAARGMRRLWIVSLLLFLPALAPVLAHRLDRGGLEPSGFIQMDQPYYLANAREHFDDGSFRLTYGLPFTADDRTPRTHFQPQTLILALLLRIGLDPAVAFLAFGCVAGVVAVRLALLVFEEAVAPLRGAAAWLTAVTWIWGGGLLVLAGLPRFLRSGALDDLFAHDPGGGLWFLNFGRNLIFPMEAYYHAAWLGAILLLLRRRTWACVAVAALVAASHPFTGLELLAVLLSWMLLETAWLRSGAVRAAHVLAVSALLAAHLLYYRVVLPSDPDHAQLVRQWLVASQDWTLEARHFVPAGALVVAAVAWRLRTPGLARTTFSSPPERLFAAWAFTCFALANNEVFLKPNVQPLHFTRGYAWMGLFLLGAPAVLAAFRRLTGLASRAGRVAACGGLLALALADNATFLATFQPRPGAGGGAVRLPRGFRDLAAWLSRPELRGFLVICRPVPAADPAPLPYLLTVYTPLRSWVSHLYNTPYVHRRVQELLDAFDRGEFLPEWSDRRLVVLVAAGAEPPPWVASRGGRLGYRSDDFTAWLIEPAIR